MNTKILQKKNFFVILDKHPSKIYIFYCDYAIGVIKLLEVKNQQTSK